ncbi:MAG: hypothetical protein WAP24_07985 [Thermacetogeniaceae bacterium]
MIGPITQPVPLIAGDRSEIAMIGSIKQKRKPGCNGSQMPEV